MRFASLGSGSKGNATVVQCEQTLLMIDCGFSIRETVRRLERLGLQPEQLCALLVTHEHSDHASGIAALSRKFQIPVYMTHGTFASKRCADVYRVELFNCTEGFRVGGIEVEPVAVPHDAREPVQFLLRGAGRVLGILTDLGSITASVSERYGHCHGLILECNHDPAMLFDGSYPLTLKRRVAGDWGHLSNAQAAQLLASVDRSQLQHLVIAHISEKNNTRERVEAALASVYGCLDEVLWADQAEGVPWLQLD